MNTEQLIKYMTIEKLAGWKNTAMQMLGGGTTGGVVGGAIGSGIGGIYGSIKGYSDSGGDFADRLKGGLTGGIKGTLKGGLIGGGIGAGIGALQTSYGIGGIHGLFGRDIDNRSIDLSIYNELKNLSGPDSMMKTEDAVKYINEHILDEYVPPSYTRDFISGAVSPFFTAGRLKNKLLDPKNLEFEPVAKVDFDKALDKERVEDFLELVKNLDAVYKKTDEYLGKSQQGTL